MPSELSQLWTCPQCGIRAKVPAAATRIRCVCESVGWPVTENGPPADQPGTPGGPGTELSRILARLGMHETSGCPCRSRAILMDHWGVAGCRERLPTIIGWLREEAQRRRLPFSRLASRVFAAAPQMGGRSEESSLGGLGSAGSIIGGILGGDRR